MIQLKWIFLNCLFVNHRTLSLPVVGDESKSSTPQPYINIKIRDQDDSLMEEFFKGENDPIFNAPTKPGDFSGIRWITGTISLPEKPTTERTATIEPKILITIVLPDLPLIHAHLRGNRDLMYEETEYVNASERLRRVQEAPSKRPTQVIRDFEMIDSALQGTQFNMGIKQVETKEEDDSFWNPPTATIIIE